MREGVIKGETLPPLKQVKESFELLANVSKIFLSYKERKSKKVRGTTES